MDRQSGLRVEGLEDRTCPSLTGAIPVDSFIPVEQFSPAATGNPDTAPSDYRAGSWSGTSTR